MAIDKTGKLAMDVYNDLKPHQQQFLDNQLISETNPLLEITAMGGTTMMAGAIKHKEELTEQVIVTGVDEADDLMEAMALTMDSMDIYNDNLHGEPSVMLNWKTIAEERLRPFANVPITGDDLASIYRVRGSVGKHRGPKGGGAQRLAKRRKANKAARKARRK